MIALRGPTEALSEADRGILERALRLLEGVKEFSTPTLPTRTSLQTMAPFHVLDETFEAVSTATDTTELVPAIDRLIGAVAAMLEGSATSSETEDVATFFDRLSALTLTRSSDLARPTKDRYRRWIVRTPNSSVG